MVDKSLGTNLHLWLFFTRAKHIFSRSPPPPPPIQCWTRAHAISLEVQHCMGRKGGKQRILKRKTVLFLNSVLNTQKISAITQVSQGILSTTVGQLCRYVTFSDTLFRALSCN